VDTYVRESLSKSIIRDITLKEGVLHIKSNSVIYVRLVKDFSEGIVPYKSGMVFLSFRFFIGDPHNLRLKL